MSEVSPRSHERHEKPSAELKEHHDKAVESAIEKGRHARHEHAENLLHHEAQEKALPSREHAASKIEDEKPAEQLYINRELKDMAYRRTLQHAQKQLRAPERVLSKFMHNEVVDSVSEVAGKTIARPSGVLFGGIIAVIGSSIFLWTAKHYGYEYNFLLFALLFVGGFALGLLIELGYRLLRRPGTR
jgi:hypothetical protein